MAALPGAWLMLIGDGPLRAPLDELISDLGAKTRVRRVGAQPEARRFIRAADSVVISSRWEGLPLVALRRLRPGSLVATNVRGTIAPRRSQCDLDAGPATPELSRVLSSVVSVTTRSAEP